MKNSYAVQAAVLLVSINLNDDAVGAAVEKTVGAAPARAGVGGWNSKLKPAARTTPATWLMMYRSSSQRGR